MKLKKVRKYTGIKNSQHSHGSLALLEVTCVMAELLWLRIY